MFFIGVQTHKTEVKTRQLQKIKHSKILYKNKAKEEIDSDYNDVPTRKSKNDYQPYVCIIEDIPSYLLGPIRDIF